MLQNNRFTGLLAQSFGAAVARIGSIWTVASKLLYLVLAAGALAGSIFYAWTALGAARFSWGFASVCWWGSIVFLLGSFEALSLAFKLEGLKPIRLVLHYLVAAATFGLGVLLAGAVPEKAHGLGQVLVGLTCLIAALAFVIRAQKLGDFETWLPPAAGQRFRSWCKSAFDRLRGFLPLVAVLLCSDKALALQMEFHTYNGFTPIEMALQKVELVFSDNRYLAMFGTVILGASLLAVIKSVLKALGNPSQGLSLIPGFIPILTGTTIVLGMVFPKGTLILHDDVLNKQRVFTNVPDGIVAVMGTVNAAERQLMDIFDTTSGPASYLVGAGGIGFDLLGKISGGQFLDAGDKLKESSLQNYLSDCLLFEMTRTGTSLDVNAIHTTDDWIAVLDQAVNPAVYTMVYTDANPEGVQMTCTDAWEGAGGLKSYFGNANNLEDIRKNVCAAAGIDSTDAAQYQACQTIIDEHLTIAAANNASPMPSADYIRQAYMARALDKVLSTSADTAAMAYANRNLMTQGMSTLLVANEFMPVIRGVMTSIVIGLVPILVLLLPTGAFSKVVNLMVGFFFFLASWGVLDSWLHGFAVDLAMGYFQQVAMNHTGYAAIMLTPDAAGQALGVVGMMRTASISLAMVIASAFGFSSGAIMAQLSGQMMSPISQGASQGANVASTEGRGHAREAVESAWTTQTVANIRPELLDRTQGKAGNEIDSQAAGKEKYDNMEATQDQAGENVRANQAAHAAEREAAAKLGMTLPEYRAHMAGHRTEQDGRQLAADQKLAEANGMESAAAMNVARATHGKQNELGQQAADEKLGDMLGMDQQQLAQWRSEGGVLSQAQAQRLRDQDMTWAAAGMALSDIKMDQDGDLHSAQVGGQVTEDNLEQIRGQIIEQAMAPGPNGEPGLSLESANAKAEGIVPGMMMTGRIGENGPGEWTFAKGVKAHETYAVSRTDSKKDIKQDLVQDTTSIKHGMDADVYQAALSGDDEALAQIVARLHAGEGNIDDGRQAALVDNLADHIGKRFQMSQGNQKGLGGSLYGQGAVKGGLTVFGNGGEWEAGGKVHANYDRTASEHNDVLRNRLQAEADQLREQYESGALSRDQYDAQMGAWLEGTAQHYHERGIERGDGNAAENFGQDVLESGSELINDIPTPDPSSPNTPMTQLANKLKK